MKTTVFTTLTFACLLVFVSFVNSCVNVSSQSSQMHEAENKSQANNQAPEECLAVFREFFAYVQKSKPDIATDEKAQNRWLTKRMRKAFVERANRPVKPDEISDNPTNETFVLVWNRPTTYSIAGTRHYDFRNADNPNDNRVIIDVLYEWDEKPNGYENQYPCEKSLHSFIFVFEEGVWKLDDIYTFDDEYTRPESLRQWSSQP